MKTQKEMVLEYLKQYGKITPLDALREFAVMRLSAIIYNLRKEGYKIETEDTTAKNRFGSYVTFATYLYKD